mmetsp:Transcript_5576/g.13948  ORF Transcript_5576/g.13948 Transcript_5576/m.13948 type:complete len:297 (-) Transcript_5576:81-971(-)
MECSPVESIPPFLVHLLWVRAQALHLPHCTNCTLGAQPTHDHDGCPSILRSCKIDVLFVQHTHQRLDVGIRSEIPSVKKHILERFLFVLRRFFAFGDSLLLRKDDHVALPIHHLILLVDLLAKFLPENALLLQVAQSALEKNGTDQRILGQIERTHDALNGKPDDHSFPHVKAGGHKNSEERGANETASGGKEVIAEHFLRILCFGIGVSKWLGRRGHIHLHSVGLILRGGIGLGENEQDHHDRYRLHGTVNAPQHEDDVGIFAVQLSCCKHDRQHHKHLVERHLVIVVSLAWSKG